MCAFLRFVQCIHHSVYLRYDLVMVDSSLIGLDKKARNQQQIHRAIKFVFNFF